MVSPEDSRDGKVLQGERYDVEVENVRSKRAQKVLEYLRVLFLGSLFPATRPRYSSVGLLLALAFRTDPHPSQKMSSKV